MTTSWNANHKLKLQNFFYLHFLFCYLENFLGDEREQISLKEAATNIFVHLISGFGLN